MFQITIINYSEVDKTTLTDLTKVVFNSELGFI